jgi:hypothetical protein
VYNFTCVPCMLTVLITSPACLSRCDADPTSLSNYIIAVLERDMPLEQLRESCIDKLEEFLGAETRSVVGSIFDFLQTGGQTEVEVDRGTIRAGGVL